MTPFSRQSAPFRVGDWSVDPATGQLSKGGEVRRARPLVADLLLYLATRPGEVVTKDELVAGPWGGAAIADSALTSTVAELRLLLDDQPKAPRYIETLPKRGYRLIAPVTLQEPPAEIEPGPAPAAPEIPAAGPATVEITPIAPARESRAHPQQWSRRSWTIAFVLGAIFAVAVTISIASRLRPAAAAPPAPRPMRLTVDLPRGVRLAPDTIPRLAINAEGSRMAYVVRGDAVNTIYVRAIDQFDARAVDGTAGGSAPFFSADGSRIGYFAGGELRTVPVSGGAPSVVCAARVPLGATWGADDAIVFSGTHGLGLFEVSASGGEPRPLTTLDRSRRELSHRWPQLLPDGERVLYTAIGQDRPDRSRADVMVVSRRTGEHHVVVENAQTATFIPPNQLLFERDSRVMAATLDLERFEVIGSARVIVEDLLPAGPGFGNPAFAVGGNGVLVYAPNDPHETERELVWVDRTGRVAPLGLPAKSYMHPRLSADSGGRILTWLRTNDPDSWIVDVATRGSTRVVTGVSARRTSWSPDGTRIMFDAPSADNPVSLYEASVAGGGARRLRPERNSQYAGTWTPDGRTIAFVDLTKTTGFDIITMRDEPNAERTPLLHGTANENAPAFSPDGRRLAYVSDESGHEEVYVLPVPTAAAASVKVSAGGGREPVWSRRGDELFFRQGQTVRSVRVTGDDPPRVSEPVTLFAGEFDERPSFLPNYDLAPDGRFLMIRGIAPPVTDTRIAVLLKWDVR